MYIYIYIYIYLIVRICIYIYIKNYKYIYIYVYIYTPNPQKKQTNHLPSSHSSSRITKRPALAGCCVCTLSPWQQPCSSEPRSRVLMWSSVQREFQILKPSASDLTEFGFIGRLGGKKSDCGLMFGKAVWSSWFLMGFMNFFKCPCILGCRTSIPCLFGTRAMDSWALPS